MDPWLKTHGLEEQFSTALGKTLCKALLQKEFPLVWAISQETAFEPRKKRPGFQSVRNFSGKETGMR